MLRELSGDSAYAFPGPKGEAMNWVQKACERIMESAGIEDGRHHDTRRVLQTNMAEMGVPPHVSDMILNHSIKDAPRSRQHYDVHHYIPEKRQALVRWVERLTEILGYDPNEVMKAERTGHQVKGAARRLGAREPTTRASAPHRLALDPYRRRRYTVIVAELRFTWDPRKATANVSKHGVSFEEAQWVFYDEHALVREDPDHSEGEDRFLILGLSSALRILMVVYCEPMGDEIRIISVRKATKTEQRQYLERLKR